jgi:uncharacterized protein (TIGR01777 family)
MRARFTRGSFFSVSKKELFEFHERADAFKLLTPAFAKIEVESTASTLAPSDEVVRFALRFGPLRFRFENVHTMYQPFDLFVDEQREGLFTEWRHEHRFREGAWAADPASLLTDEIVYAHPLLVLFDPVVRFRLGRLFEYRHRVTAREVHRARGSRGEEAGGRVVVTGATGLIGKRIVRILVEKGSRVVALARDVEKARKLLWRPRELRPLGLRETRAGGLEREPRWGGGRDPPGRDALFERRWNAAFKREMEESRVAGARQLVEAIGASAEKPRCSSPPGPRLLRSRSGAGRRRDRPARDDLLARICVRWESEARKLDALGVRTVQMRIGIVLSRRAGALKEVLPLFRIGFGGTMGDPRPTINWIHLEDVARMFTMALWNQRMRGPYNAAAPSPVTNGDFARGIARALGRPALMRYPLPVLKIIIGEAGEYASGGPRVEIAKIQDAGYRFFFSDLEQALAHELAS